MDQHSNTNLPYHDFLQILENIIHWNLLIKNRTKRQKATVLLENKFMNTTTGFIINYSLTLYNCTIVTDMVVIHQMGQSNQLSEIEGNKTDMISIRLVKMSLVTDFVQRNVYSFIFYEFKLYMTDLRKVCKFGLVVYRLIFRRFKN